MGEPGESRMFGQQRQEATLGGLADDVLTAAAGFTIAIGFVVSFLVALVVVRTFIGFVGRYGLKPFGWYRIVVGSVVLLASLAAYVFARIRFRGRELLFNFFTLGLLFPIAVAILPLYITLRQANLVDSLWGVILPQVAFGLPGNILILRGFFATIPRELEEAAAIDGCTHAGFFVRVLLPLIALSVLALVPVVYKKLKRERVP